MNDKELFEQLARGPLTRNGFDESLQRKINDNLDKPTRKTSRPWLIRWSVLSTSLMLIAAVVAGVWSWRSFNLEESNKQSLRAEQAAASSESLNVSGEPPHSAVVIGLREDHDQDQDLPSSTYRTILVAPKDEELEVIASGSGIWMPYKTNFWKVDTGSDSLSTGMQTIEASLAGQMKQETDLSAETSPQGRTEKLLFAGNRFVSILQTTNANVVGVTDAVGQSQVWVNEVPDLDPSIREKDFNALENNHFTLLRALGTNESGTAIDQWAIAREPGKWVAKQQADKSVLASSIYPEWQTISLQLTEKVTGPDALAMSWEEIRSLVPTATDAFTSVDEDIVAIVTDSSIILYPYTLNKEKMKPLSVPISVNESVVMVQWATGQKYVDNWKRLFGKWFSTPAEPSGL